MEKSIKINIAGIIFQINEDAYELLREYLQAVTNRLMNIPGGSEMVDDIEARIAEIFQSKPSWQTAVISKEEVTEIISTMGSPEEIAGDLESDSTDFHYRKKQKNLYRNTENSIIGGVCSGIADYTGTDAVWIRVLFVIFTFVYLVGALVYVVLWIALPSAGSAGRTGKRPESRSVAPKAGGRSYDNSGSAAVGNAFNEVFKAFGKFFIIFFRVILAITGIAFILSGFSGLLSYILVAFFHSGLFSPAFFDTSFLYLPDFMAFIADPSLSVWLIILTSLVIILPLLALIYWGIRMVFQFRIKDMVLNITMLIIWVLSCTALAIILFTEGISFSNSGRTSEQMSLPAADTIYFKIDDRISSLDYDKKVHLPFKKISLYLDEEKKTIYGRPELNVFHTGEEPYVEILKYSNGLTRADAISKAKKISFVLDDEGNNIGIDEYYTIPEGNRWSGAFVKIRLYIPDKTTVYFDDELEELMQDDYFGCGLHSWKAGGKYWKMTDGRLKEAD